MDSARRAAAPYSYVANRGFDDFDELAESVRHWDLDLWQVGRGPFRGQILQFEVDHVCVNEASFSRALIQKGAPPSRRRTFAIPAGNAVEFRWRGEQVSGHDLVIFPRGAELDAVSTVDFHVFTCSFPEALLANISESLHLGELDEIRRGACVVRCQAATMERVRTTLRGLCAHARQGLPQSQQPLLQAASRELAAQLIQAVATAAAARSTTTTFKRELAVRRAISYIEHSNEDRVRIGDVCRAAQVSQRTLEYAFLERFGLTPKAYVIAHRLNEARRELRCADGMSSVTDVANRWGFWHMGQFAADYRKQFGELPSETIHRTRQTAIRPKSDVASDACSFKSLKTPSR